MYISRWITMIIVASIVGMVGLMIATMIYATRTDVTRVVFLDVGQGDAILITHGARQILIDGGINKQVLLEQLAKYMPFWDRMIDVVIATHPDADHIGAQIGLHNHYYIPVVIYTDTAHDSPVAHAWMQSMRSSGAKMIPADMGIQLRFSSQDEAVGNLRILYPHTRTESAQSSETNSASIVARLEVAGTSFLLTGDLPSSHEHLIMNEPVNVLKVGHHGSRFSTANFFLDAINAQQAVISVGRENSYGHPTDEVLERLRAHNVEILRTDERGTIIYTCQISAQKCDVRTER